MSSYAGDAVHSSLGTDLPRVGVGLRLPWVKLSLRQVIGHTRYGYEAIALSRYVGHVLTWPDKEFTTSHSHT